MKIYDDQDAWLNCHDDDLWLFDKVIVASKLGYSCGPKGVDVPNKGKYIIRPVMNLMGMGRGAYITELNGETDNKIPDGTFWCEVFEGRHLSVDYQNGKQILCVEGIKSKTDPLNRWKKWIKTKDKIKFPNILKKLSGNYEFINVEFIDDKIIEIHLRRNPDFILHDKDYIIPSYDKTELNGHIFIPWKDYDRIGFFIPEK